MQNEKLLDQAQKNYYAVLRRLPVTNDLHTSLESALFKLYHHFQNDPETLHEAVSLVFSSIFRKFGIQCTIVGGQSVAYWMRMPSSTDVDFVTKNGKQISEAL